MELEEQMTWAGETLVESEKDGKRRIEPTKTYDFSVALPETARVLTTRLLVADYGKGGVVPLSLDQAPPAKIFTEENGITYVGFDRALLGRAALVYGDGTFFPPELKANLVNLARRGWSIEDGLIDKLTTPHKYPSRQTSPSRTQ